MSDYISRQAAIDALWKISNEMDSVYYTAAIHTAVESLESLPTADVVPVVHGRWIDRIIDDTHYVYCSECGDEYVEDDLRLDSWVKQYFKYCPVCGAKMDGGEDARRNE